MVDLTRRAYVMVAGSVPVLGAAAGCVEGFDGQAAEAETGTLATHVSDQPVDIGDFDTLLIQIDGIRVKPQDDDLLRFDADAEVDLTELVGEASELVSERELETGTYEFLQLDAEATEATLTDGGSAVVEVPGEAPLKFNQAFEIRSGQTTSFTADFTPVKRGQTGRYVLQPVANEVKVSYEES